MATNPEDAQRQALMRQLLMQELDAQEQSLGQDENAADFVGPRTTQPRGETPQGPLTMGQERSRLDGVVPPIQGPAGVILNNIPGGKAGFTGLSEVVASAVTGAGLEIPAGIFGIGNAVAPGGDTGAQEIEKMRNLAYVPKTEVGLKIAQSFGDMLTPIEEWVDNFSEWAGMGNPIAQTAIKTAIYGIPEVLSAGEVGVVKRGASSAKRAAMQAAERMMNKMGINPGSKDLPGDIAGAATAPELASQWTGENMETVRQGYMRERNANQTWLDAQWDVSRELSAGARAKLGAFKDMYDKTMAELKLSNYDVGRMGRASEVLEDWAETLKNNEVKPQSLPEFSMNPMDFGNPTVKLERLHTLRERLFYGVRDPNKMRSSAPPHPAEIKVLEIMKNNFDEMTQRMFDEDMIEGNPEAINAWKKAVDASADFKNTFDTDAFMRRMFIEKEATVVELKRWLLGANAANRAQAGRTMVRLNKLFGKDSPEMDAVRREVALDIVEPLMGSEPNLGRFIKRYENIWRKNRPLMDQLGMIENSRGMDELYKIAMAAQKVQGSPTLSIDLNRAAAVALFGHEIARKSLQVSTARNLANWLKGQGSQSRRMLHELANYDETKPMFPKGTIAFGAFFSDQVSNVFSTEVQEDGTVVGSEEEQ